MTRKQPKLKMRRSGKFVLTLLLALIVMMFVMLQQMNTQLVYARSEQAIYASRLAQLQEENARLAADIANSDDPDLIEDIARNDLGMAEQNEKIFRFRN